MTIDYETVDIPKVSSDKEPNPHADAIAQMTAGLRADPPVRKAAAFIVEMGTATKGAKSGVTRYFGVEKAKRQFADAGAAQTPPVTVRVSTQLDTPKKGQARVTFWVTEKITRKAAASTEPPAGESPTDAPAADATV